MSKITKTQNQIVGRNEALEEVNESDIIILDEKTTERIKFTEVYKALTSMDLFGKGAASGFLARIIIKIADDSSMTYSNAISKIAMEKRMEYKYIDDQISRLLENWRLDHSQRFLNKYIKSDNRNGKTRLTKQMVIKSIIEVLYNTTNYQKDVLLKLK